MMMTKRRALRMLEDERAETARLRERCEKLKNELDETGRLKRISDIAYDELRRQMSEMLAVFMKREGAK